ncbi:MAG TPA: MarC family protein [Alphaproteobacteria bacterium]
MPFEQTLAYGFIALFVIIDPVGTAALFAGLTRGMTDAYRQRMARRAVVVAGLTLLFFAFAGEVLLEALGIGLPAFRIAGGALLFLLAIDMVFPRQVGLRSLTETENREAGDEANAHHDISVFPLAIPLIAGPGALTTMVLLMRAAPGWEHRVGIIAVLAVVLAILFLLLLISARVVKLLGTTGVNVVSRVLGILLAALAAQLVLDGLAEGLKL